MRNIIIFSILVLSLSSCQRTCTSWKRGVQAGSRNYEIIMFSGGDTVFHDTFTGMLNNSESSDGVYYYKDGMLIEVSGDYVIKSE